MTNMRYEDNWLIPGSWPSWNVYIKILLRSPHCGDSHWQGEKIIQQLSKYCKTLFSAHFSFNIFWHGIVWSPFLSITTAAQQWKEWKWNVQRTEENGCDWWGRDDHRVEGKGPFDLHNFWGSRVRISEGHGGLCKKCVRRRNWFNLRWTTCLFPTYVAKSLTACSLGTEGLWSKPKEMLSCSSPLWVSSRS